MFRRIRHLISWLPVIWRDQDWDWEYLVIILNRKLSNMEAFFGSDMVHLMNSDSTHERVKYARILTDRILADEYFTMAFEAHEKRWGKVMYGIEGNRFTTDFPGVETERDAELCARDARVAFAHETAMKKQDIDELFATMAKYIQGWWD